MDIYTPITAPVTSVTSPLILSARNFGARGDGGDDTAGLNAMTAFADQQVGSGVPVFELTPGTVYKVSSTWIINSSKMGLRGNGAIIDGSGITDGSPAVYVNSYGLGTESVMRVEISNLDIAGAGRDQNAIGLRLNSDAAAGQSSVRASLRNIRVRGFKYGISVKSKSYLIDIQGFEVGTCKYGLYQESGATAFAENFVMAFGCFHDCDCLVHNNYGNIWRFYGVSFDYFGDATGNRITADDRMFNLAGGAKVFLDNCHFEWNYGKYTTQTNMPILLSGANTGIQINGGRMFYAGGVDPLYASTISSNNASQLVRLRDVRFANLGLRAASLTGNLDALVAHSSGTSALVQCTGIIADNFSLNDLPSIMSHSSMLLRNGMDDPFSELGFRASFANSTAQASQTLPTGSPSVAATPNGMAKCTKLTGPGTAGSIIRLSLPIYGQELGMWCFWLEGGNGTGSLTVRERATNGIVRANTSGNAELVTDGRGVFSNTKTITLGSAGWQRVSWKDVWPGVTSQTSRRAHNYTTIEIDISNMSAGYVLLGDLSYNQG